MHEQIGKIRKTHLGYEGHGIFTLCLDMDYGGSGQSIGGYALDEWDEESRVRLGTAYGMDFIIGVMAACGVDQWEKVAGRTILVLRESDEWNAKVVGIKSLPTEGGKQFLFADAMQRVET